MLKGCVGYGLLSQLSCCNNSWHEMGHELNVTGYTKTAAINQTKSQLYDLRENSSRAELVQTSSVGCAKI